MGRDALVTSDRRRRVLVETAFAYWRARGFPYPKLSPSEVRTEFERLCAVQPDGVITGNVLSPSTVGLRLANAFHPQMWSVPAHRHRRAPIDYFNDDETLRKLLHRAPRFWPARSCWNPQCVRALFRMYGGGRVANFRPAAAKTLVSLYSRPGGHVLDFSAGFGGRLLGSLALERTYTGIEPARRQLTGLRRMIATVEGFSPGSARILDGCAEDVLPTIDPESVDLILSSPPYFNIEKYSIERSQSYRRYSTYSEWQSDFLCPVISGSHQALRRGGHLVINVANVARFPVADDVRKIARPLFDHIGTLHLQMHSRPEQRSVGDVGFRAEPVFIFRKQ